MENELYKNFGKLLTHNRTIHGYSRSEIAERLNITKNAYGQYERGERRVPLNHLLTLSLILEFNIDEFFKSQCDCEVRKMTDRREAWEVEFGPVKWEDEEVEELKLFARYLISKRGEKK